MKIDEIIAVLRVNRQAIEAHWATALYVFGSRARGDNTPASDLDIFVDYDASRRFSLFNLVRIKRQIETLTGLPADVTTRDSLMRDLRDGIEAEALRVF
jgi:predicted nucleotidyltransferase